MSNRRDLFNKLRYIRTVEYCSAPQNEDWDKFMEVVVQEMVKGDKHVAWNMKIRPLCTLRAPGCGCSAPHAGASIRGFPTLVYCNARLPSLVPGCLSLEGVSGVSVENPLGSSENKCHKNMPGLEQGKRE